MDARMFIPSQSVASFACCVCRNIRNLLTATGLCARARVTATLQFTADAARRAAQRNAACFAI